MMQTTLRPALVSERAALEALQWRASLANPDDREALLAHPDAIELPAQQIARGGVFLVEQGARILGFAAILSRADGDQELDALFVEPACWRQGVGRRLVMHCLAEAWLAGAKALHVVGNPQAADFYRACGFLRQGTEVTRFGVGLLMMKPLV